MASAELDLAALFYIYPVLLTLTLVGAQCLLFYRNRRQEVARASSTIPDHKPEPPPLPPRRTRRLYAWLIWSLQLLLSGLLVASIALTVKEALRPNAVTGDDVAFAFSAYLVSAAIRTLFVPDAGLE